MSAQLKLDRSTWELVKLGDLATEVSVRVENPAQLGIEKFVGLEHFVSGDLTIKSYKTTKELTSATKQFQSGDILFARRNAYLRRASMVDFDGVCSGDAFVLRENHDRIMAGFLALIVNSEKLWDFANSNAAGTMSKRVKWRDLVNYEFLLPPKAQQAEIAKLLWASDDVKARSTELHEKLSLCLSSFRMAFIGQIDNTIHKVVRISEIGSTNKQPVQVGPFGGSVNSRHFVPSGVPVIKINNLNAEGELDLSKLVYVSHEHAESLNRYRIESGDVLTAAQATTGRSALADSRIDGSIISQHLIRVAVNKSLCCSEYLYEVFSSSVIRNQIDLVKAKTTRDGLNTDDVSSFQIPLPEMKLQDEFIKKVAILRDSIKGCRSKLYLIGQLQKSLINQVF